MVEAEQVSTKAKAKGRRTVAKNIKSLERLNVQYVEPSDITPNDYNPNRQSEHDFELLVRSMSEDGFTQPIIVHKQTNQIVDGEHRWRAAQKLGYDEIPVVYVEMTPEQMRVSTLRHNRARGSEDIELAAQVLRDLQKLGALDHAQDSLMLDDVELNRLLNEIDAPDALAGEFFEDAWVPDDTPTHAQNSEGAGTDAVTLKGPVGDYDVAMSKNAVEAQRDKERRIAAARSAEERQMIQRDSAVVRVSLIFTGDEAKVVKSVLGSTPAESLVSLCVAEIERRDEET
jgi:ParB/RepB/Spo0J family partition protein